DINAIKHKPITNRLYLFSFATIVKFFCPKLLNTGIAKVHNADENRKLPGCILPGLGRQVLSLLLVPLFNLPGALGSQKQPSGVNEVSVTGCVANPKRTIPCVDFADAEASVPDALPG